MKGEKQNSFVPEFTEKIVKDILSVEKDKDGNVTFDGLSGIPSAARRELRGFFTRNKAALIGLAMDQIHSLVNLMVDGQTGEAQLEVLRRFSDRELMDFYELTTKKMRSVRNKNLRLAAITSDMVKTFTTVGLEALDLLLATTIKEVTQPA